MDLGLKSAHVWPWTMVPAMDQDPCREAGQIIAVPPQGIVVSLSR